MSYPCTQCGLCCLHAEISITGLRDQGIDVDFPYGFDTGGCCEQYDKEKRLCKVYDSRPMICNIDKVHEVFYSGLSRQDYYHMTAAVCNVMVEVAGMDEKYKVRIKKTKV